MRRRSSLPARPACLGTQVRFRRTVKGNARDSRGISDSTPITVWAAHRLGCEHTSGEVGLATGTTLIHTRNARKFLARQRGGSTLWQAQKGLTMVSDSISWPFWKSSL